LSSTPSGDADADADEPNLAEGDAVGSGVYVTSSERKTSSIRRNRGSEPMTIGCGG
jgi:hypothetical protein